MDNKKLISKIIGSSCAYGEGTYFDGHGGINTCVNPYSYHMTREYPELYEAMDGIFVDGMIMCWFVRLFWGSKIPRLSFDMSGMAVDLFDYLENQGEKKSIGFIGTEEGLIDKTIERFQQYYPNMNIVGYRHGFFATEEERNRVIHSIVELSPDFLIVGMGSPLQEQFAIDVRDAGYNGTLFTCGGFLHQSANRINYYPDWVDHYNLRAFYRLTHEKGLWKRLYNVLIQFPILFTIDSLHARLVRTRKKPGQRSIL